jgi:hypothetical protein
VITPTNEAVWVARCPTSRVYNTLTYPRFDHAGQPVLRPKFSSAKIPCACGQWFEMNSDGLSLVTIAELSIHTTSPDSFVVTRNRLGAQTEEGPMNEKQLRAYLESLDLIDETPSRVLDRFEESRTNVEFVASVVHWPVGHSLEASA